MYWQTRPAVRGQKDVVPCGEIEPGNFIPMHLIPVLLFAMGTLDALVHLINNMELLSLY